MGITEFHGDRLKGHQRIGLLRLLRRRNARALRSSAGDSRALGTVLVGPLNVGLCPVRNASSASPCLVRRGAAGRGRGRTEVGLADCRPREVHHRVEMLVAPGMANSTQSYAAAAADSVPALMRFCDDRELRDENHLFLEKGDFCRKGCNHRFCRKWSCLGHTFRRIILKRRYYGVPVRIFS